jgi:hypothetical protein
MEGALQRPFFLRGRCFCFSFNSPTLQRWAQMRVDWEVPEGRPLAEHVTRIKKSRGAIAKAFYIPLQNLFSDDVLPGSERT